MTEKLFIKKKKKLLLFSHVKDKFTNIYYYRILHSIKLIN